MAFQTNLRKKKQEEIQRAQAEKIAEIEASVGSVTRHYPRMRKGGNVFLVFPDVNGYMPYRHISYHGALAMKCGHPDPIPDNSGKLDTHVPWTLGCPWCEANWKTFKSYKDRGETMPDEMFKQFLDQKSKVYTIFQALELTPFFDWTVSGGKGVYKFGRNNDIFTDFLRFIVEHRKWWAGERAEAPEVPTDWPEDVAYAAQASIGFLRLKNYDKAEYGAQAIKAYETELDTLQRIAKASQDDSALVDPFYDPTRYLLTIDRIQREKKAHYIDYATHMKVAEMDGDADWFLDDPQISLLEFLFEAKYLRDLRNLNKGVPQSLSQVERAWNLCELTPEDIEEVMNESGRRPYGKTSSGASDDDDETGDSGAMASSDRQRSTDLRQGLRRRTTQKIDTGSDLPRSQDASERTFDDDDIPF